MLTKKKIGVWNGVPVYTDFLPIGTRRTGQKLDSGEPKFAVIHDTGNKDTSAQANVNYFKNTYNISWNQVASAHIFVDDVECIICIPVTEKAWHVLYNTTRDNFYYGDDANDIAFGIEFSYFSSKTRSLKSLDNGCRVLAALCNSWDINPRTHMPGHQDIQSDKIDPGNLLAACGYKRSDMKKIDDLVVKYMKGDAPVKKVAPTPNNVVKSNPKSAVHIRKLSKKPYYKGKIQYDASLRKRKGTSLSNYSWGQEIGIVKKGIEVYIFEEIKDAQGNSWCRTYSDDNNGWVHRDTIDVTKIYIPTPSKKKAIAKKESTVEKGIYTVKPGDYLFKIAKQHKVTVDDLKKWNKLTSDKIFPKQLLKVVKPATTKPKTTTKKKAPVKKNNKLNPIQYLESKGFKVSSDPNKYPSGKWGLRNYTEYGINYDSFCGGYHRAYDLYREAGAPIPAVFDGVVVEGTSSYGNFGGTVVVANEKLGFQVIYGHLRRPVNLKIGQKIKQGQTVGLQGATNYYNNFMNEHLHIQFQPYQYFENEVQFVCSGIDVKDVDVSKYPAINYV